MLTGGASGYGRELFSTFTPSSARGRIEARAARGGRATPLLSGALVARHREALGGPVVEVGWPKLAADAAASIAPMPTMAGAFLTGVFRAVRHADAVVAVSVPFDARGRSPGAPRQIVDDVLAAADAALLDRPLILVARAAPLPPGASVDRLSEGLYRDLEAGFTAMAFAPAVLGAALEGGGSGDLEALVRLTAPLVEQDLGLELELEASAAAGAPTLDTGLLLARVEDAGLALSAVRGAGADDELGGALLVVDRSAAPALPAGVAARVVLDERLWPALTRAVSTGDAERVEATAWLETAELLGETGAAGTASRLLDALASGLRR